MDFLGIKWNWEDMCGPSGLHPWNDTTKDFGICFQELCLQIPILAIIAVVSGYYVGYRKDWVLRERTQERAITLRSFVVLALALIPIIQLYVYITDAEFVLYPIDYFTAGTSCLSWLVHFGYVLALKHRLGPSPRGSTMLLVCWLIAVMLNVVVLRSSVYAYVPTSFHIATLVCHFLYFLSLIPTSHSSPTFYSPHLVGSQYNRSEYTPLLPHMDEGVLGTAMQGAAWYSKLNFSWVNPLLNKGLDNVLNDVEELFDVPVKCRCSYVGARIDKALIGNVDRHQMFEEVPHEPFISSGYGATGESVPQTSTPVTATSRVLVRPPRRQNVTLFRALHSCFAVQFYSIGILKFVSDMSGFAGPILLNKLLIFVQDETIDVHYGYWYASGLMASSIISAYFNSHFNWLMSLIGIKMQGAIISTIMRKTLSVTSTELTKAFSIGEITNFMSTDTDRIVNACPSFHALWSIPLQLFITLFLLYQQVGISFLAGVAFSMLLIPINKMIAGRIGKLSAELMARKDTRVSLVTELLRGIRTVKMHVWEDYFIDKVTESRSSELMFLRGRKYLDAVCVVLWAATPVLVAALTMAAHALRGGDLNAPVVFTTVALVNMLIAPLNAFPWVLNGLTEAWVSVKRIQKLLELPDMDPERYYDRLNTNRDEDKIIIMNNASFAWATPPTTKKQPPIPKKGKGKRKRSVHRESIPSAEIQDDEPFMLRDISLEITRDAFIGVAGAIGSGKTSLLHAIIGGMVKKSGSIQVPETLDSFGYASQTPWLVRGTVRDNILFGKPYDETRFRAVVDACALTEDLNVLGWNANVGDGGCTLSGGQRARISLARAVYQDKQVYILDDVLSGVDGPVAQHILQRCILGLLKRTTRILVAHSPRHLARAHTTILMHGGRIVRKGPPGAVLTDIEEYLPSETDECGEDTHGATDTHPEDDKQDVVSQSSMDTAEAMSQGSVKWWVLGMYLRSVGYFLSIAILLSLVLMQLSQNLTFLWLTYWVRNRNQNTTGLALIDDTHENTTLLDHGFSAVDSAVHSIVNTTMEIINNLGGRSAEVVPLKLNETTPVTDAREMGDLGATSPIDMMYLEMYFGLVGVNLVFTVMRAFLFAYGGVEAATKVHKSLLKVVVTAKVKFFDTTPTGRIVNRFSSDTYTVDDSLPFILNILLAQSFSLVGALAVTVYSIPLLLAVLIPMAAVYHRLQRRYRVTSRQLKRLQSVTLAPVYTHFGDTLQGLTSIRALGSSARWLDAGADTVERYQRATVSSAAAAAWLALRLQSAAVSVVFMAAFFAVVQRGTHGLDAGLVGLAISYALSLTSMLSGVMNAVTETEREMIAVERIGQYIREIECEKSGGDAPPYGWPSQGVVTFEDVHLTYSDRPGAPPALAGVSFSSYPGEALGVAGRTGAGKSSLLQVLLRLREPTRGRVLVDGVDVATLNLHALRSRVGVMPQDPFLFAGSVRDNVDPLRARTDAEVRRALERCGDADADWRGVEQLSRGKQQLLCLARAVLHRPKILILDEATANLDPEMERVILDTCRLSLAGSTVLYVAHRAPGVLACSRVIVLAQGRVCECDAPSVLMDDPTSQLYRLMNE